jgi:hypothetical protein
MNEFVTKFSEVVDWLPLLISVLGLLGIILAVRGTLLARKDAYNRKHADYLNLKERVQEELKKD